MFVFFSALKYESVGWSAVKYFGFLNLLRIFLKIYRLFVEKHNKIKTGMGGVQRHGCSDAKYKNNKDGSIKWANRKFMADID